MDRHVLEALGVLLQLQSVPVVLLPEAMDDVDSDQISYVWVEGAHEEGDVVQVVEVPALRYERVAEQILERDGIFVRCCWEVADLGQLEGRLEDLSTGRRWFSC